jgi:CheY-like chemotaxis protein
MTTFSATMNDLRKTSPRPRPSKAEPILLADDAEDNILGLYHAFKHADIPNPLFVVYDGQHAIEYLAGTGQFEDRRKYPLPCLVLLSTDLSQKTGLEVLQWIREANVLHLPVVLMADSATQQELSHAVQLGASDYVLKSLAFAQKIEWAKGLRNTLLS